MLHQFVGTLALPHALDRLVQDGLDAVAVRRERGARGGATQDGPRVARHHVLRSKLDHLLETGDPILGNTQPRAPDRADVREGAQEVVSGHQDALVRQPDRDRVHRLAGCVEELQSHAGNRQQQLVAAERAGGRQVAFPSRRRDPPEFHLNAGVDVQRIRQRHAELVAAIAPGAADVRHRLESR